MASLMNLLKGSVIYFLQAFGRQTFGPTAGSYVSTNGCTFSLANESRPLVTGSLDGCSNAGSRSLHPTDGGTCHVYPGGIGGSGSGALGWA